MVEITPFMKALQEATEVRRKIVGRERAGEASSLIADVNSNHDTFKILEPGSALELDVKAIVSDLQVRMPAGTVPDSWPGA